MKRFLLVLALLSSSAFAAEVQVWGRSFNHSCGYFSNSWGDYDITFRDTNLPWGSKVTVVVAFGGYRALGGGSQSHFDWDRDRPIPMDSIAPFTWRTRKSETLHSRTSNLFFTHLNFIFKVESPGRAPQFVNGGSSWGYYQVPAVQYPTPCVDNGSGLPAMKRLELKVVRKN